MQLLVKRHEGRQFLSRDGRHISGNGGRGEKAKSEEVFHDGGKGKS
jgi:hypothetical protein